MAELRLPPNSRVMEGKVHVGLESGDSPRKLRIYRYDPDSPENPRVDTYEIDATPCLRPTRVNKHHF